MQFSVERAVLLKTLSHVQSVVERRGTIPILANVKIEAAKSGITLTSTDMDMAMIDEVAASVSEPGAITVPAHMLYEIVRKLPDGVTIDLSTSGKEAKATIKSGSSRFTLSTLPVEDFPAMAEDDLAHQFEITVDECRSLIQKTRFAISTEETRYYLNGIYFHTTNDNGVQVLRAVSTDGHRLARVQIALPDGAEAMPGVIVPRKTIAEMVKLMEQGGNKVKISLSETKIRFVCGTTVLLSKLIDGTFPDYDRVIPTRNDKIMEVEGKAFAQAVDRVSVIASEKSRGIKLGLEEGKITLSATSAEQGTADEVVEVKYGADSFDIGFNSRYLLDVLGQIEGETAQFVFADSQSPAIIRDPADLGSLYVIMPMRV